MCRRPSTQLVIHLSKYALIIVVLLCMVMSIFPVRVGRAGTQVVTNANDTGSGSLRQAIADAAAGDTILFDSSLRGATITLTSSELAINKRLTISGLGASELTIHGNDARRVFNLGASAVVTITGLTIAHGYVNNARGGGLYNAGSLRLEDCIVTQSRVDGPVYGVLSRGGSGIYNSGTLTVVRSTISNNSDGNYSAGGGGIYNVGFLELEDSTVRENQVHTTSLYGQYGGGGLYNQGVATLLRSSIISNTATSYSSGGGGGISNNGALVLAYSTVSGNTASDTFGGGIFNSVSATLTIEHSLIIGNQTTQDGGGIENVGALTITHSTLHDNAAYSPDYGGGGLDNTDGMVVIENSTISGNRAISNGGGILNYDGTIALSYSTITSNTAQVGGGIFMTGTITDTMLDMSSSIIANSLTGLDCAYYTGTITTTLTLIEDNTCNATLAGDPQVGPLRHNGGDTPTHALQPGSPAIDQGACPIVTTDQRDYARPIDIPSIDNAADGCDLGAFEAQYVDLLPIKLVDDQRPIPGQIITYTITVQNVGLSTARDAVISDTLDSRLIPGPITLDPPSAGIIGSPPTLVSGLEIAVGQTVTVTFPATIATGLASGTIINNTVAVTSTDQVALNIGSANIVIQNVAPVANDDTASTDEDTALVIQPVTNDSDLNGDTLSIARVGAPTYGQAVIAGSQEINYTPANRMGAYTDVFTYTVSDGRLIATAQVAINVSADNDPLAITDTITSTTEDTSIQSHTVVSDPDTDDTLSYALAAGPAYGSATVNASTGMWTYTPANRMGDYSAVFTVAITDSASHAGNATVTVDVTADNDAPTANDATTSADEDTPANGTIAASDPDTNDTLTYSLTTSPNFGSASINTTTGAWIYTPTNRTANYTAVFTVTVADTASHTDPARVIVNVTANNDAPTASADIVTSTNEDTPVTGTITASDPDTNETFAYSVSRYPNHGSASVNAISGAWVYTPTNRMANYTAVFTLTVTDSGQNTDTTRVTVNVTADNDAVTANDVTTSISEDATANGTIAASDLDTDDTLSYSLTASPAYGTASINATTGAWTYNPINRMANYTAIFTVTVADTASHTDPVLITINVTADNDGPTANDATASTTEDASTSGAIVASDPDSNDTLTYSITTNPNYGAASVNATTGAWTYTPTNRTTNYTAIFTVTAADSANHTDPARVTVNVTANNDLPTADDATASTNEDTTTTGTITASDPDTNDTLTYSITSSPTSGSAAINATTGAWAYTPTNRMANYTAIFTVTVTDSASHIDPARVTVNVTADNDVVTANDATATTTEDTSTNGTIAASDPDTNDTLTYSITGSPTLGSATINATTGAWTYTPINRMENYTAIFTVTVADTASHTDPARVTVSVTANNDGPTANDATASTNEDTSTSGTIAASDPDTNDTLTYSVSTNPNYGTASVNATTGAWVYTPINRMANYTAIFTVTVADTASHADPARVTVNVTANNDGPTANDATASTNEDAATNGTIAASDPDTNDTLTYSVSTNPNYGAASINAATGAWIYTPTNRMANYTAIFTVTVADTASHTDPARVTVSVTANNDPVTASDMTRSTTEDATASGTIAASDPDTNDTLTYAITTNPNYGVASITNATGAWVYTPTNRTGNYTAIFTVTVTDSASHSDMARVTVNVTADNDPVTTNNMTRSTTEDATANGTIAISDPDTNDTFTYSVTANPNYGTATVNATTGAWIYTPANRTANYTAIFTITVADSASHTGPARVTVNVTADNDPVTANEVSTATTEDSLAGGTIAVTDPDTNDAFAYAVTTQPGYGTASVNATTGAWIYSPTNRMVSYTVMFTITVSDSGGYTDPARVTVNVTADNDPVTANDVTAATNEDTATGGTLTASDPDTNDTRTYSITTAPNYGAASINAASGVWVYTPTNRTANYTAVFTVTVADLVGHTDPAKVTINVSANNDTPTANGASTSTNEDTSASGAIVASDPDTNDTLTYSISTNPNYGTASVNAATGVWTYSPANRTASYTAVFTISVADTGAHSVPARVTVSVAADNDPIVTNDTATTTSEDAPAAGIVSVTEPDTDDTLHYALITHPVYGAVGINPITGRWVYTPANRMATYTSLFTVIVTDTAAHTDMATVMISVNADNDWPTAVNASAATDEDTIAIGHVSATDPDMGDTFTYALSGGPTYGNARVNSLTGAWVYTPTNRTGNYTAIFTVTATDTAGHPAPAVVTITVSADNEAPQFVSEPLLAGSIGANYAYHLIVADADADATFIFSADLKPAWLTLSNLGNGTALLYGTPGAGQNGLHPVELRVTDNGGLAASQQFSISIDVKLYLPLIVRH